MHFSHLNRRDFITLISGGATTWPLAARAQHTGERRIGVLAAIAENDPEARARVAAFRQGLREVGWMEGRNVHIEFRWAADDSNLVRAYAAELVRLAPDVIVTHAPLTLAAVQQETRSLPIVFLQVPDPVEGGFVASLAQPGGNTTGFTSFENTISAKWLELLKEVVPSSSRVAIIRNPAKSSGSQFLMGAIEAAAPSLGLQFSPIDVRDLTEIERAFDTLVRNSVSGLILMPDPITLLHRDRIIELAAKHKLPAVYSYRFLAALGGLISYGSNVPDMWRRAAFYVDRILKGTKPADLPIQNPTKYELVVNLKTAKALGIELPLSLLMRIDEVIE
jgi:putative ABC transport system substrate-binding protein